ncbi:hypothetical protein MKX03_016818, partial [Papaver bracteatum]
EYVGLEKTDNNVTGTFEASNSDGLASFEAPPTNPALLSTSPETVPAARYSITSGNSDVSSRLHEFLFL